MSRDAWNEAIARSLRAVFGAPVRVEPPEVDWDGRAVCRAVLPDGQRAVVKADTVAERHWREAAGLRAARVGGAPVPDILWSGYDDGRWYLVLAEVPTRIHLDDDSPMWRRAGAAVRRLHAAAIPPGMRMFCEGTAEDWVQHMLHRIRAESAAAVRRGLLTPAEAAVVDRHAGRVFAEAGPGARALLHGDLQSRHILVHEGDVTLVDFGDAGWGDPVLDLVVLTHWSPSRLGDVLDGYGADEALRTRVGMLWTTYSTWRHLFVSRWYHENAFAKQRSAQAVRRVLEDHLLAASEPAEPEPADLIRLEHEVVLLDFDGLLVDTEFAGWRSWSELFAEHGGTLSLQEWARNTGSNTPLSKWDGLDAAAGTAVDRVVLEARRRVRRDALMTVLPGARALLAKCRTAGLRIGLVSNSPMRWIERQMSNLGLAPEAFDLIVSGDGVAPKPAPDGYLQALEKFGVDASRAVAFEDSAHGVAAAKAAGLSCVAVPNRVTAHTDLSRADLVVESLARLDFGAGRACGGEGAC